jgi:FkbM family methyltransferase
VFVRIAALAIACLATAGVCAQPAVQWRLDVLRNKLAGRYAGVAWSEILTRLPLIDAEENGGRWVLGSVRVQSADAEGVCPVLFDTEIGPFRGRLEDEWEVEHLVNKYLGLNRDSGRGLTPRVEAGDTVLELGAWLGVFTRHALMRGAARVIAVEPAPENLACLRQTFAAEIEEGKVVLIEGAAWDERKRLRMKMDSTNNPRHSSKGFNVDPGGEIEVQGLRLDDVLRDLGVERIDLMNLDIEGAERYALAGARETIRRSMPEIVVCVHHKPDDEEAVLGVLREIAPEYEVSTDGYHARLTRPEQP